MHYRYRETVYHINIVQGSGGSGDTAMTIDGETRAAGAILSLDWSGKPRARLLPLR